MKRNLLRLAIIGMVTATGAVAIVVAQRNSDKPAAASEPASSVRTTAAETPPRLLPPAPAGANPLRPSTTPPMSGDPFSRPLSARRVDPPPAAPPGVALAAANDEIPDAAALPMPPLRTEPAPAERAVPYAPPGVAEAAPPPQPNTLPAPPRGNDLTGTRGSPAAGSPYLPPAAAPAEPSRPLLPSAAGPPANLPAASASDREDAKPLRVDPFGGPALGAPPPAARALAPPRPAAAAAMPAAPPALPANRESLDGGLGEGAGRPGAKSLEGPQMPQLTIQKLAPAEIQVGKPANFRITVRNSGNVPAAGVEIHDTIPKGTRVLSSTPKATQGVKGDLVWTLGTVKPGEEVNVEVQLMPTAEGEIGSVATVQFAAEASARTIATRPQLVVESALPERVTIGESLLLRITVSNPGTGIATGVVIEEHIPAGLQHPDGPDLEYVVGELRPGESRKLDLALNAVRPGPLTNLLTVRGDGNLRVEDRRNLEITAPAIELALEGPKKRYLDREATYQVSIHNPGTAPAERVELVAYLPPGLKFVSANNAGHYDEANRAVFWRLEELPVNETGTVSLVTLPVEAGQQALKLRSTAERGVNAEKEHPVIIEGIAAMLVQTADTTDPVEVGGETSYEIRVLNQGSKAATNVRLTVALPPELKPLAAEGPTRHAIEGNRVSFDGLARLAPKADATFRVRVQGLRPGDLRTRVQLMTDEMQSPVTNEESTRVFADE